MAEFTTRDGTQIFFKDWGSGQPIVFSHGWPLSADDWDTQMLFFLKHGYRVIAHDRRGHGRSRSEEHTSELQSQSNLVCRLLLEKKKTNIRHPSAVVSAMSRQAFPSS